MTKILKALRLFTMIFFLALASFGMVNLVPVYRDRFRDKEIRTEQVEKKDDDGELQELDGDE
jgi:hypothetical protein